MFGDFFVFAVKEADMAKARDTATTSNPPCLPLNCIGIHKEPPRENLDLGDIETIPGQLAYATTVHKGQGLTIEQVLALLESLFAHGQVYVQTSRTPLEKNFKCIGVPPRDIFE